MKLCTKKGVARWKARRASYWFFFSFSFSFFFQRFRQGIEQGISRWNGFFNLLFLCRSCVISFSFSFFSPLSGPGLYSPHIHSAKELLCMRSFLLPTKKGVACTKGNHFRRFHLLVGFSSFFSSNWILDVSGGYLFFNLIVLGSFFMSFSPSLAWFHDSLRVVTACTTVIARKHLSGNQTGHTGEWVGYMYDIVYSIWRKLRFMRCHFIQPLS